MKKLFRTKTSIKIRTITMTKTKCIWILNNLGLTTLYNPSPLTLRERGMKKKRRNTFKFLKWIRKGLTSSRTPILTLCQWEEIIIRINNSLIECRLSQMVKLIYDLILKCIWFKKSNKFRNKHIRIRTTSRKLKTFWRSTRMKTLLFKGSSLI